MKKSKVFISIIVFIIILTSINYITNKTEHNIAYNDHTPRMIKVSPKEVINRIKKRKKGVYYLGFPECPWCIELLPELDHCLKDAGDKSYVLNVHDKSFNSTLRSQLTVFYKKYVHEKEIYVPLVVAINSKHEVRVHLDTVNGHNAKVSRMTNSQREELKHILDQMICFARN